jgi:hypothetical protein
VATQAVLGLCREVWFRLVYVVTCRAVQIRRHLITATLHQELSLFAVNIHVRRRINGPQIDVLIQWFSGNVRERGKYFAFTLPAVALCAHIGPPGRREQPREMCFFLTSSFIELIVQVKFVGGNANAPQ